MIAVVTGSGRGLGAEICRQLRAMGWLVYSTSRRSFQNKTVQMDVTWRQSIVDFKENSGLTKIDLLINNAGIFPEKASILEADEESLAEFLSVNSVGPLMVTQEFWPLLVEAQGRVINISSQRGLSTTNTATRANYSMSKSLLNHITRLFAIQGELDGVIVNAICPGHFKSDMGGPNAPRSVEDAAHEVIWLGTQVPRSSTGKFYLNGNEVPW
jgi:NAD(P)-dependent dehydrogenase (short-subunit alcohol dehydrogenase family)